MRRGYPVFLVLTLLACLSLPERARAQLIESLVGSGTAGYSGDGGPASGASVNNPFGVTVDRQGNVYIADTYNQRIRVVNTGSSPITVANVLIQPGKIATIAGNGAVGFSGDGGPATSAKLNYPFGVAVDRGGNVYIADLYNFRVRKVDPSGMITTVTGNGTLSYSGDNAPAINAGLDPYALAVDSSGNLYIADVANQRIRVINMGATAITLANKTIQPGFIATVAGNGTLGSAQNGPGTSVQFNFPYSLAVDALGNVFICDTYNRSIRVLNTGTTAITVANVTIPPGYIATVAGDGQYGYKGDGGPATSAEFADPDGVAVDNAGNIYISDLEGERIRFINNRNGLILTIAGVAGTYGYNGDGMPATAAWLSYPRCLTVGPDGNVYFADEPNQRIREIAVHSGNPAITSKDNAAFVTGVPGNFVVTTNYWPTPTLTLAGALPAGIGFSDYGNGTARLGGTPAAGTSGAYNFTLTASNGLFPNIVQNFILTVYPAGGAPLSSSAVFISSDTQTKGNWQGIYGIEGYSLANVTTQSIPSYASFSVLNQLNYTWATNTSDPTALQIPGSSGRIAATWYSASSFNLDLDVGPNPHQIALYALDWGDKGRLETIQIQDAKTGFPLDTEVVSYFAGSTYLVWRITGHVQVIVTTVGGSNAVVSAVFFGVGPGSAPAINQQPRNVIVAAGQSATFSIQASGGPPLAYQWQSQSSASAAFADIPGATANTYAIPVTQTSVSGTQYRCVVTNNAGSATSAVAGLTVLPAGSPLPFVITKTLGTSRNDYSGWVGMALRVGPSPLTINGLGRIVAAGNSATHNLKIVDGATGADVPGTLVAVPAAGSAGSFVYGSLALPVTLNGNAVYYVVSQEFSGGDLWYDRNTTVQTQNVATVTGGVYGAGPPYTSSGAAGQTYGPVDLLYGGASNGLPAIVQQPQNATITAGQTATYTVSASGPGLGFQWQSQPPGGSGFADIPGATGSSYSTPLAQVSDSGRQFRCVVSNSSGSVVSSPATLTVQPAPSGTPFVSSKALGTSRNDYSGWVGMTVHIGPASLTVTALGRIVAPGNSGSHVVKIVDAASGADVPGGSVSVSTAGAPASNFVYRSLSSPVVLAANGVYYLVSQETAGGDQWFDKNTTVQTQGVASVAAAVYGTVSSYVTVGNAGQTYGPVDLLYTVNGGGPPVINQQPQDALVTAGQTATFSLSVTGAGLTYQWQSRPPGGAGFTTIAGAIGSSYTTPVTQVSDSGSQFQCLVTSQTGAATSSAATLTVLPAASGTPFVTVTQGALGTLRNNYSGWVGMAVAVGSSPITITALGRYMAAGNAGIHTMKVVQAGSGVDVPGAAVAINMAGGSPGSFVYGTLPGPISLSANTVYFIVTQETAGGDQWYDYNTVVQTTGVGRVASAVYSSGSSYITPGSAGQTYGPVNFQY